jgi:hypothetical protein
MNSDNEKLIVAFTGTLWEAEMVKSLLMNADIESFLQNSTGNSYACQPILAAGVKVIISDTNSEAAKEIVEEYSRQNQK